MPRNNNWTRNELIVVFNLYCKIPFTKINDKYKPVIETASIIGRSPGAVSFKLANFARLDPSLQSRNVGGLKHGSKGEVEIWNEFHGNWESLAFESELLLASYKGESIEESVNIEIDFLPREGLEREAVVKLRVNQSFFRKTVLVSYENKCCITGISSPELLVASHIVPWALDLQNRVNPTNGLSLNALHDRAYDKGLITITPDFKIKLSDKLIEKCPSNDAFFLPINNKSIILPKRFLPDKDLLNYHYQNIFIS